MKIINENTIKEIIRNSLLSLFENSDKFNVFRNHFSKFVQQTLNIANKELQKYDLKVEINTEYEFFEDDYWLACYERSSGDIEYGIISIALNEEKIYNAMVDLGVDENLTEIEIQAIITIMHEVGHGIIDWYRYQFEGEEITITGEGYPVTVTKYPEIRQIYSTGGEMLNIAQSTEGKTDSKSVKYIKAEVDEKYGNINTAAYIKSFLTDYYNFAENGSLKYTNGKNYYMRGTFTHNNPDFLEDIKEMLNLGFTELSMEPVVSAPDDPAALTPEDLEIVKEQYEILAKEKLPKEPKEGKVPDSVFFLLDVDRNILLGAVNIRHYLNDYLLHYMMLFSNCCLQLFTTSSLKALSFILGLNKISNRKLILS